MVLTILDAIDRHISRIGCGIETLGEDDCTFLFLDEFNPGAIGLGRFPSYCIESIHAEKTLENLEQLPDNAGSDALWNAIVIIFPPNLIAKYAIL